MWILLQLQVDPDTKFRIFQWLVPLIALMLIVRTAVQFYKKQRSSTSTMIWVFFWLFVVTLAVIPDPLTEYLADKLGFADNVNALIFSVLGFMFLFIFYLSSKVETLEYQLTDMVRRQAIKDQLRENKEKDREKALELEFKRKLEQAEENAKAKA